MKQNIFKQNKVTWLVEIYTIYEHVEIFKNFLEDHTQVISCFETEPDPDILSKSGDKWMIWAYFDCKPEESFLQNSFELICQRVGIEIPQFNTKEIEDKDWVAIVQKTFSPTIAGEFFIYGSHDKPKENYIPIEINAGRAFGTGEHESTKGCLEVASKLDINPNKILDLGCGSGILSIAAAKKWQIPIIASDIDEQSVETSRENFELNNVTHLIKPVESRGFDNKVLKQKGPYDLIFANILSGILVELSPEIKNHLSPGGIVILSGFLNKQANEVLSSYKKLGFALIEEQHLGNWTILALAI